jgi:organic radical activating enzyme
VAFDRKGNQLTLPVAEVAARIVALGQKRLVITGGEPLLQAGKLAELTALLPGMAIEIETNGTIDPSARLDVAVDQYNVSPKLAHSGNPADLALNPRLLDRWATDPRAFFKFVIGQPADVAEVLALARTHAFVPSRVFLMAEGTDSETLRTKEKWLAPLCVEHGFRLSDRLHIHLYGDTRGT